MSDVNLAPLVALWRNHKEQLRDSAKKQEELRKQLADEQQRQHKAEDMLRSVAPLLHKLPGGADAMRAAETEMSDKSKAPARSPATSASSASSPATSASSASSPATSASSASSPATSASEDSAKSSAPALPAPTAAEYAPSSARRKT